MIQKKPKRATTGKLGEMEIWWGRRAAKKGYYRQAKRDGDTEKPKRETIDKRGGMETCWGRREANNENIQAIEKRC